MKKTNRKRLLLGILLKHTVSLFWNKKTKKGVLLASEKKQRFWNTPFERRHRESFEKPSFLWTRTQRVFSFVRILEQRRRTSRASHSLTHSLAPRTPRTPITPNGVFQNRSVVSLGSWGSWGSSSECCFEERLCCSFRCFEEPLEEWFFLYFLGFLGFFEWATLLLLLVLVFAAFSSCSAVRFWNTEELQKRLSVSSFKRLAPEKNPCVSEPLSLLERTILLVLFQTCCFFLFCCLLLKDRLSPETTCVFHKTLLTRSKNGSSCSSSSKLSVSQEPVCFRTALCLKKGSSFLFFCFRRKPC